jgi:hypothetical protein
MMTEPTRALEQQREPAVFLLGIVVGIAIGLVLALIISAYT